MRPYCYLLILLSLFFSTVARAQFEPVPCPEADLEQNPAAVCSQRGGISFLVFGTIVADTPSQACVLAAEQLGRASNTTISCSFEASSTSCACTDSSGTPRTGPRVTINPVSALPACPDGHFELDRRVVVLADGFRALLPSCLAPEGLPPVEPELPPVEPEVPPAPPPVEPEVRPPVCPVALLPSMSGPLALQHESGKYAATSDLEHLTPATREDLACLQKHAPKAMPVSGFRPNQYQLHLKAVWDAWQQLQANTSPECKILRDTVRGEWLKHKLIRDPVINAAQAQGTAVDVAGLTPEAADKTASRCGMSRPDAAGSPLHFQSGTN